MADVKLNARATSNKRKNNVKAAPPETFRTEMHTLSEHHDHLLSTSFDVSYQGNDDGPSLSSSQGDINFGFNDIDDLFALPADELVMDDLADELAKELGWVETPLENTWA